MNNGKRPHSRPKNTGSGSTGFGKGRKVDTGSRPVGSGSRPGGLGGGSRPSADKGNFSVGGNGNGIDLGDIANLAGSMMGSGKKKLPFKLNLKTIIIIAVIVIVGVWLLKNCEISQTPNILGELDSFEYNDYSSSPAYNDASYGKPDMSVSRLARDRYYTPAAGDDVTVMVYMCGTDLESKYGMATKDLNEMLGATIADNVNLIVMTGGCGKWQNNVISSSKNQIYKIENKRLTEVENNFGTAAMTDPSTLSKFIRYCKENYAAERNILIFWDHGGGSVSGYGYDEKHPNSSSMTLSRINSALEDGGCKFDFIGFDACLMATLETDLVCNNYADYMIASEETEPGTGWYYTNWLTMLSNDTSVSTVKLGQQIIDDFVASSCSASSGAQVTLSVVDLAELAGTVPDALTEFAVSTNELVRSDGYKTVSDARAGARQFSAENRLNQVDLIDMAERIGTAEAKALASALRGCVKYNKTTISRSNGISVYFPYETTKTVNNAVASINDIAKDDEYSECMGEYAKCIKSFASLEYGGQIAGSASQSGGTGFDIGGLLGNLVSSYASGSGTSNSSPAGVLGSLLGTSSSSSSSGGGLDISAVINLLGAFSGRSMPENYAWVDTELISDRAENIASQFIDGSRVVATEKDGKKVLTLTDDEWGLIETVELNVFASDGEGGYVDLGLDNTFDWADDNSLLLDYDGTWLTLDGHLCAYYLVSDTEMKDGSWVTVGRIPALLNGEFVNLRVIFDREHEDGAVTGAYPLYENDVDVMAKGNIEINPGDNIELLCDCYDGDGKYLDSYTLGEEFTVSDGDFELINLAVDFGGEKVVSTYRLTDIYGNHFWVSGDDAE